MKKLGFIFLAFIIAISLTPWAVPIVNADEPEISIKPASAVLDNLVEDKPEVELEKIGEFEGG